jgi:cell division protein FtsI/penicillin-binding protein 2
VSPLLDRRQRSVTGAGLFLLLSLALLGVGARMGTLANAGTLQRERLEAQRSDYKDPPFFTLTDRHGTVLAQSVPSYSIEASPFHLWLAHTPERVLNGLAEALALDTAARHELSALLFALDEQGELRISRWPLTRLEAEALDGWIRSGGPRAEDAGDDVGELPGWRVELCREDPATGPGTLLAGLEGPFYELVWRPQVALSQATRERHGPDLVGRRGAAALWAARLARGLLPLLEGPRARERAVLRAAWDLDPRPVAERPVPRGYALAKDRVRRTGLAATLRDAVLGPGAVPADDDWVFVGPPQEWVFDGLVPRRYALVQDQLTADRLPQVRRFLAQEELSDFQLWLEPTSRREYPVGELAVLGTWEWWPSPGAADDAGPVRRPSRGLENLGYVTLRAAEAERGDPRQGVGQPHLVAGEADGLRRALLRPRRPGDPRDYYLGRSDGVAPAAFESSLDLELQRTAGRELEALLADHDAALAMAVVIELETREVLALDWRAKYASIDFPPLQHAFTPGSTFKLVTAALALEQRLVEPTDVYDVGYGSYVVREPVSGRPGRFRSREVGEAEGFATGRITVAECVAHSSNSGMVQIGHQVPVAVWKEKTRELGYGLPVAAELLAEGLYQAPTRVGEPEDRGGNAWGKTRSHTSVCFGDSVSTTLLQHAQALAALVDDGRLRPLRFARAYHVDGRRIELPTDPGRAVVRPDVSAQLRAMMRLGAAEGTGEKVVRPPWLALHTKTGTTEKLRFDVCAHKFWSAYAASRERGESWDDGQRYSQLRGQFAPRRACYVSSIVALAQSPVDGRRVLVLVVADDPHGPERFGSKVAGPTAVNLLVAALGLQAAPSDVQAQVLLGPLDLGPGSQLPWDVDQSAAELALAAGHAADRPGWLEAGEADQEERRR